MKDYNQIYNAICQECAEPMEEMRKKARNGIIIVSVISLLVGIILMVVTKSVFFIMLAIIVIALYGVFSKNNKEYKNYFKQNVVKRFVTEYDENLNYAPESGIESYIYNKGEFEHYDRYHTEDLIYGMLKNEYEIKMAEVHTENESRDSDGNTSYTTVFHGLFAEVKFNKLINSTIKIRKNGIILFDKEKLNMDSGEFEKKFDVFAEDKIVAMQLLTADIMQMLLEFKEQNKITPEITLKEDKMYIRFKTKDMFEASYLKSSIDYDQLKKYYDTINFTLDITEKFLKNIKETEI
jgi:hypothetical protein